MNTISNAQAVGRHLVAQNNKNRNKINITLNECDEKDPARHIHVNHTNELKNNSIIAQIKQK